MKYRNKRDVLQRDPIIGRDKGGHPIGGHVLEVGTKNTILVSPDVHTAVWCDAHDCIHLDDAFPGPVPEEEKTETEGPKQPEKKQPEKTDQKPPEE